MSADANFWKAVLHSTVRTLMSLRGLLALLFSLFMMAMLAFVYDKLPPAFFELFRLFTSDPDLEFQWLLFDNTLSKLITLFLAPMFIFDAISGDRSDDRFGLLLSRPMTRTQYLCMKLLSAFLAFGAIFLLTMAVGYPIYMGMVDTLTPGSYFGTAFLMYLLAFFTMAVGLLVSALTKRTIVSFIAMFGLMAVLMMPNAMKYTSDSLEGAAMLTPHYYATYFTSHSFDGLLCVAFAGVVVLFATPFIPATMWKFNRDDL